MAQKAENHEPNGLADGATSLIALARVAHREGNRRLEQAALDKLARIRAFGFVFVLCLGGTRAGGDGPQAGGDMSPTIAPTKKPRATVPRGYTVLDLARLLRVSPDKVRGLIARGELEAINTATTLSGRRRWVILPEMLAAFVATRKGGSPRQGRRRRQKRTGLVDYFPE